MIALILAAAALAPSGEGGPLLSVADARRVLATAQAEAILRKASATLVIVDQYGELVLVEAAADAQGALALVIAVAAASVASAAISQTAVVPPAASPVAPYGQPIIKDGRLIGAVGVAGGGEDVLIAQMGAKAVN